MNVTKTSKTRRRSFSKFIRHPERYALQLQPRDLEIMRLVYDYRFIPSHHITRLIAGSERKILERLQRLFHHGYLDRLADRRIRTKAGSDRMVYAITKQAADLLVGELGLNPGKVNWAYKNRAASERHIKHTLMIAKFRTCITLACREQADVKLGIWKENRGSGKNINRELTDRVTITLESGKEERRRIIPDALLSLQEEEYDLFFYLEADRSTMTNDRFLKKLRAYWTWWKAGGSQKKHGVENFRVLVTTRSYQRRDNLRKTAQKVRPNQRGSGMFWFACEKDFSVMEPLSILGPIWITPKDNQKHRLLE